ncbi:MAG TPA: hypothetical protein VJB91_00325, partial [Patescibacteria group bacterium]|nr:hypothetical protein [Patescibacteria group bacterium]
MLRDLFISKVRVEILKLFLVSPEKIHHIRGIVRAIDEEINAVRRELKRMEKIGLMSSEWRANRKYYRIRRDYLFYQELLSMISKITGLGGAVIQHKNKIGRVKYAMVSRRFLKGEKADPNEVDMLIVGNIILPELASIVREQEAKQTVEINYTVMSEDEFTFRKRRRDPFILSVLESSRVMLIGDEDEMV